MASSNLIRGDAIRVAIITKQRLFREAIGLLLQRRQGFDIVADAEEWADPPGLLVVDSSAMQGDANLLSALRSKLKNCPILVLVHGADPTPLTAFIGAGVEGLLDWTCSADSLHETLRRVHAGETVIAVSSARQILRLVSGAKVDLTQRERQVIREVAAGKSNFAIARALGVTENTIKGHLVNIFEKLGLSNRVQVASYAFENGLAGPASEAAGLEVA